MLGRKSAIAGGPKRTSETTRACDGGAVGASSGLLVGARVATAMGWRPVEALEVGDLVLTFDAGLQPLTQISSKPVWSGEFSAPKRFWPLHVPAGALGNRCALTLLPNQFVMIESDAGEELFGDPFSLIKSEALNGLNGIDAIPPAHGQAAMVLHFDTDQVAFDQSGVLYYCPSSEGFLTAETPFYTALTQEETNLLMMCIKSEATLDKLWVPQTQERIKTRIQTRIQTRIRTRSHPGAVA